MRDPCVVSDVVDGKAVLVDPAGREIITLNALGTLVWGVLDGIRDLPEVCRVVGERYPSVSPERISVDVEAFLAELSRLGLLTEAASDPG